MSYRRFGERSDLDDKSSSSKEKYLEYSSTVQMALQRHMAETKRLLGSLGIQAVEKDFLLDEAFAWWDQVTEVVQYVMPGFSGEEIASYLLQKPEVKLKRAYRARRKKVVKAPPKEQCEAPRTSVHLATSSHSIAIVELEYGADFAYKLPGALALELRAQKKRRPPVLVEAACREIGDVLTNRAEYLRKKELMR